MKKLHLTAAAVLLASSTAAFAQDYSASEPNVLGGGAVETASSAVGGVANGVVGGVGSVVGGVAALPGQLFQGRSASDGSTRANCNVLGGGAAGTCNSAR